MTNEELNKRRVELCQKVQKMSSMFDEMAKQAAVESIRKPLDEELRESAVKGVAVADAREALCNEIVVEINAAWPKFPID